MEPQMLSQNLQNLYIVNETQPGTSYVVMCLSGVAARCTTTTQLSAKSLNQLGIDKHHNTIYIYYTIYTLQY